jgi:hypothetical protein
MIPLDIALLSEEIECLQHYDSANAATSWTRTNCIYDMFLYRSRNCIVRSTFAYSLIVDMRYEKAYPVVPG